MISRILPPFGTKDLNILRLIFSSDIPIPEYELPDCPRYGGPESVMRRLERLGLPIKRINILVPITFYSLDFLKLQKLRDLSIEEVSNHLKAEVEFLEGAQQQIENPGTVCRRDQGEKTPQTDYKQFIRSQSGH